jgi:hypothetical protein
MAQIPIFVISLARAPERRRFMQEQLDSLGLSYEIVDATDGKLIPEVERTRLQAPGACYVPGVIGCYMSHIGVYQLIVDRNLPVALILEDDAVLNPSLVPYLKAGNVFTGFDYCLLDSDDCSETTPVFYDHDSREILAPGFPVYQTNVGPALLHAYLMTREGAARRIAYAWPIVKPVDIYSSLPYEPKILVCVDPKGAAVSEHSRQSFTSSRFETAPLRLRSLRRFPGLFKIKDWLKLKPVRGWLMIRKLQQQGLLSTTRRWRPMPTGRNITVW